MDSRMDSMKEKLEAPWRLAELRPDETMRTLGLRPDDCFCDIGAGTGIFIGAALALDCGKSYAVDTSETMREYLAEYFEKPVREKKLIITRSLEDVPDASVDLALLCTVLHEADDKEALIRSLNRVLVPGGRAAVIEFRPEAVKGPPAGVKISGRRLDEIMSGGGFSKAENFLSGENLYGCTYRKEPGFTDLL